MLCSLRPFALLCSSFALLHSHLLSCALLCSSFALLCSSSALLNSPLLSFTLLCSPSFSSAHPLLILCSHLLIDQPCSPSGARGHSLCSNYRPPSMANGPDHLVDHQERAAEEREAARASTSQDLAKVHPAAAGHHLGPLLLGHRLGHPPSPPTLRRPSLGATAPLPPPCPRPAAACQALALRTAPCPKHVKGPRPLEHTLPLSASTLSSFAKPLAHRTPNQSTPGPRPCMALDLVHTWPRPHETRSLEWSKHVSSNTCPSSHTLHRFNTLPFNPYALWRQGRDAHADRPLQVQEGHDQGARARRPGRRRLAYSCNPCG